MGSQKWPPIFAGQVNWGVDMVVQGVGGNRRRQPDLAGGCPPSGGLLATIFASAGGPNFGANSGPKIGPDLVPAFEQKVAPAGRPGCIKFPGTSFHFGSGVTLLHFCVRFSLAL